METPEACPMFQHPHGADHGDGHSEEGGHGNNEDNASAEEHADGAHPEDDAKNEEHHDDEHKNVRKADSGSDRKPTLYFRVLPEYNLF